MQMYEVHHSRKPRFEIRWTICAERNRESRERSSMACRALLGLLSSEQLGRLLLLVRLLLQERNPLDNVRINLPPQPVFQFLVSNPSPIGFGPPDG